MDLVEIAPNAEPPVCRIMNYDKFRYEQKKKLQEAKKKQTTIETKEIKFRPKTEEHDLNFKIKHLGVSYTYGRFNDFTGFFKFDKDNPSACAIEIDVTTDSIDSNDEGRDKHLRSPEYFDCEKYPSLTFKSTKVEKVDDKTYRVTGDLTILAVTKSVTMRMEKIGEGKDPWGNYRMGFDGSLVIKRSEFGMKTMLPMIGDEVYLTLGVEGIKNVPGGGKKRKKK